jgi:hypothetical protein
MPTSTAPRRPDPVSTCGFTAPVDTVGKNRRCRVAIKADIRVRVGAPIPEIVGFARRCEDAGLHGIGVHDHHHSGRDVYLTLGAVAAQTSALFLYPTTSNTVCRHPLVIAALANSLSEIAAGRVMLSLTPGFLSVERAGAARGTLARDSSWCFGWWGHCLGWERCMT